MINIKGVGEIMMEMKIMKNLIVETGLKMKEKNVTMGIIQTKTGVHLNAW